MNGEGSGDDAAGPSTRPYLLRAMHDWCTDNGLTPYIAVYVDDSVQVPREYVKNSEIVLNVGFEATSGLKLGNEFIEFKARFGGMVRDIVVPVDHVVAIYARENGQGMPFPPPVTPALGQPAPTPAAEADTAPERAPTPIRGGLRLARRPASETPAPGPARGGAQDRSDSVIPEDEPPSPPTSPGGRPALKRVK